MYKRQVRPQLVLENLPIANKGGYLEPHTRAALGSLAARDLKAARAFTERWSDARLRKDADAAIALGVAANDPMAVVALARETENKDLYRIALQAAERLGAGMVGEVLRAAGDRLGPCAISAEFILQHPEIAAKVPSLLLAHGPSTMLRTVMLR